MIEKIIERLRLGEIIDGYKESGNSMRPLILHREPITLAPVDPERLQSGDIVLCKVKGRIYTHLVLATRVGGVLIGNNRGHVNGWASNNNIYGIVTHVNGVPRPNTEGKTI